VRDGGGENGHGAYPILLGDLMIEMKVTGANELMAKFKEIKDQMWKGFGAALLAGAFPVSNAAKELAPYLTGNLRRSIHIGTLTGNITEPQPDSDEAIIRQMPVAAGEVAKVGKLLEKTGLAVVLVGTDVIYGPTQEFLHKPYLRPALDNNREAVQTETRLAVAMVVAKVKAAA